MVSDLRKEMRAAAFKGELLNAMFPRMILFLIIIILWYIIEPYGIQLSLYAWLGVFSFFVVILMWNAKKRTNSIMIKIDEIIDGRMDATELLEKYEGGDFPVFSSLFNKYTNDELELLLAMGIGNDEYAKEIDWKGSSVYKTRGKDSSGPAKGKGGDIFSGENDRIDAMTKRPEFDDLEGPLTKTEKLVAEANKIANKRALEEWDLAESNDQELIEAGVEKLGDLVATGHFKGPEIENK